MVGFAHHVIIFYLMENIQIIANLVTIVGLPFGILSIFIAIHSIKQAKKIEQGNFLIELRKMFATHNEVHFKLRNGGVWTNNPIPDDPDEWAKIDSYLGLFELCEILMQNNSLSVEHFSSQYQYRLENIIANDQIVLNKLRNERAYWETLLRLLARVHLKEKTSR